jgi:hypothetical protein
MWVYEQDSGDLFQVLGDRPSGKLKFIGTGYSGAGKLRRHGRNNSDMQHIKGVGPCPRGTWAIKGPRISKRVGPVAFDLKPIEGTDTLGRSALMIHGDNKASNASKGCIILGRPIRLQIAWSKDRRLFVVRDTNDYPELK